MSMIADHLGRSLPLTSLVMLLPLFAMRDVEEVIFVRGPSMTKSPPAFGLGVPTFVYSVHVTIMEQASLRQVSTGVDALLCSLKGGW